MSRTNSGPQKLMVNLKKLYETYPKDKYQEVYDSEDNRAFHSKIKAEGSYRVGQYKTLMEGYDFEQALKSYNIKEVDWNGLPESDRFQASAISYQDGTMAISPDISEWQWNFFHEVGHILMGHHEQKFLSILFNRVGQFIEFEAELFAFEAMQRLGLDGGWHGIRISAHLQRAIERGFIDEVPEEVLTDISEKVTEFLSKAQKSS